MPGSGAVLSKAARSLAEGRKAVSSRIPEPDLIGIYLNDHLAGATLGVPVRHYKAYAAWVGEKAGRLKFNGHLTSRSPLSSLEELEMLRLGVEGKAAGWRTLRTLAETDSRLNRGRLDELMAGAREQAGLLEELRVQAAAHLIEAEPATP